MLLLDDFLCVSLQQTTNRLSYHDYPATVPSLTLLEVDGSFGPYHRWRCVLDENTPDGKVVHAFRQAASAGMTSAATSNVARDIHVLQLFNAEHVLVPCGLVSATGQTAVVFEILPHELTDALAGKPALTVVEEVAALLATTLALEFLGARWLYFDRITLTDIGLTAELVAKVRCFGMTARENTVSEATVVMAFGKLLKEALDTSPHLKQKQQLGTVAKRCMDGWDSALALCTCTGDARGNQLLGWLKREVKSFEHPADSRFAGSSSSLPSFSRLQQAKRVGKSGGTSFRCQDAG